MGEERGGTLIITCNGGTVEGGGGRGRRPKLIRRRC